MDRNTIIGLTLIGTMLVTFTLLNKPSEKQQKDQQKKELARQEKEEQKALKEETAALEAQAPKTLAVKKDKKGFVVRDAKNRVVYLTKEGKDSILTTAVKGKVTPTGISEVKEELLSLESDQLKVEISTKGGDIASVQLKKFVSYNTYARNHSNSGEKKGIKPESLYLFKNNDNTNQLKFVLNNAEYKTGDKSFEVIKKTKNKIVLQHELEDGSIVYTYTIKNGYDLDFDIQLNDLNGKVMPKSVYLNWNTKLRKSERLLTEQRRVSSICFQNADGNMDYTSEATTDSQELEQEVNWVAYKQSYFSAILTPKEAFGKFGSKVTSVNFKEGSKEFSTHIKQYKSDLNLGLKSTKDGKASFSFFFGPNDYKVLKSYDKGYDDILNWGWGLFRWINLYAVHPVYEFLASTGMSAGIAILILTLILKLVLMPVQWKMFVSSAKMKILKPDIDVINAKYPNKEDAMKKQVDMMSLYRESGASPLSGCVPMLFQMPILLAVFRFFPATFSIRQKSFLWAEDLSSYDSIWDFGSYIPVYGDHMSLFTLLMAATTLVYTYLNSSNVQQQQQPGMPNMKVIMYFFPVMMIFFFNNYSAGLSYYYFISTLMTILLMFAIKKFFVNEESLKAKMAAAKVKAGDKAAKSPKKKSGFMQRLEDMQKQQQEQMKNRKK